MQKLILSSLIFASLSTCVWANNSHYKCPSINAIQHKGLSYPAKLERDGKYTAIRNSHYGSLHMWTLTVKNIAAPSAVDALFNGLDALNTLYGNPQPEYMNGFMNCEYRNAKGYIIYAFTK